MQEYEKPNVIFTKVSKLINFGKNAPWNVLKANDLFTTKPKTQPITKQLQLQGNNSFANRFMRKQRNKDFMEEDDMNIKWELIKSLIKLKLKSFRKIVLASRSPISNDNNIVKSLLFTLRNTSYYPSVSIYHFEHHNLQITFHKVSL